MKILFGIITALCGVTFVVTYVTQYIKELKLNERFLELIERYLDYLDNDDGLNDNGYDTITIKTKRDDSPEDIDFPNSH